MTRPGPPPIKSFTATTDRSSSAEPARTPSGSGAPKGGAEGVLSAVRLDSHTDSPAGTERVFFGLHIIAPPSFSAATSATAACRCGYRRSAKGRSGVLQLVADYTDHKTACPRFAGIAEKRNVA
ncbi:hypothetical protein QT196_21975 [Streptomyces sp. P9-2B-2]|uniref:hypothetical protein n=1 Tax=Streptomyces sp. P9-2B-2 TaxID=3057114 RepID=UPI0025B4E366|nr:hypothetical protein [Streptomyces sp. P9-2B-2]WJY39729.1 hypothetical protein QT196_21975 [Streptomyces sp. P9-2B-2]